MVTCRQPKLDAKPLTFAEHRLRVDSSQGARNMRVFCILAIASEWIFFGPVHFLYLKEAESEIPDRFPFETLIVIVTGLIEIVTGIAILLPTPRTGRSRRWEASVSLTLLVLFLPAIFKMLVDDAAIN